MLAKLGLPDQTVRTIVTADGVSQLRIEVPVESSPQVLVLTAPLALTTSGGGQAALVNVNGVVLATSGAALPAAAGNRAHALRLASGGRTGALTAGAGSSSPVVLSFAPVTAVTALSDTGTRDLPSSASGEAVTELHLGIMVERAVQAAHSTGIAGSQQLRLALAAALGMLALAVFAASVLWFGLIGPVRRLARTEFCDPAPRRARPAGLGRAGPFPRPQPARARRPVRRGGDALAPGHPALRPDRDRRTAGGAARPRRRCSAGPRPSRSRSTAPPRWSFPRRWPPIRRRAPGCSRSSCGRWPMPDMIDRHCDRLGPPTTVVMIGWPEARSGAKAEKNARP